MLAEQWEFRMGTDYSPSRVDRRRLASKHERMEKEIALGAAGGDSVSECAEEESRTDVVVEFHSRNSKGSSRKEDGKAS